MKAHDLMVQLLRERAWTGFQLRDELAARGVHMNESACSARIRELKDYGVQKRPSGHGRAYEYWIPRKPEQMSFLPQEHTQVNGTYSR